MPERRDGLVHLYYGPGKGKTTAAMGLVLRTVGHGGTAAICQFMKGHPEVGERYGEILALTDREDVTVEQFPTTHAGSADDLSTEELATLRDGIAAAEEVVADDALDLVVLDELTVLATLGIVDADRITALLDAKAPGVELVVTGREAPTPVVDAADYVTYTAKVKHPYDRGVEAVPGVEY